MSTHRWLTGLCLLIAAAYAAWKFHAVAGLWFDGVAHWSVLFRPFPDWGSGAELYGALLASKWIGTRTMWYGGALLAVTFFVFLFREHKLLAFYLLEGALIELLDVFWLAEGKYVAGWSTGSTDAAIGTSLGIAAILILSGLYLFRRPSDAHGT